ncbi:MAG: phage N-6-adenine-methyltransferase [Gammaproteobacteria bacterium]|nr:phage N-6-adenine-methyltransferase [Gammaproteobacteria bacterium]
MNRAKHHANNRNDWETPPKEIARIKSIVPIVLDAAATAKNRIVPRHYNKRQNGLEMPWADDGWTFWNPPYGARSLYEWCRKATLERSLGRSSVGLVPNNTDSVWFNTYIYSHLEDRWLVDGMLPVKGRIQFLINGERPLSWSETKQEWVISGNTGGSLYVFFDGGKSQPAMADVARGLPRSP